MFFRQDARLLLVASATVDFSQTFGTNKTTLYINTPAYSLMFSDI